MIVHRAFFQYCYVVRIPRFQISERARALTRSTLSETAKLSDLKSNKKSRKGSSHPGDEKFALASPSFLRASASAALPKGGGAWERGSG
jgi:hypothetical protein